MESLEGYMSDIELEEKMKNFLNLQPGSAFIRYLFAVQEVADLYNQYAIAIEDEDEVEELKYKQYIIDIIEDFEE